MPSLHAYIVGMKTIQYTIRGVSERMDEALRKHAVKEGASLNSVLLDALARGLNVEAEPVRHSDLDDLVGTWVEDPEFDRAIREMDTVDEDLWK
jgi:hypothetical protein